MEPGRSNACLDLTVYSGKPGCGKSILASGIIDNLTDMHGTARGERLQIFYFFFSTRKPRLQSSDDACRAILSQILDHNHAEQKILSAFDYAMSKRKEGQVKATAGIIWDLLVMALEVLPGSFLVLDGIDECVVPNAMDIQEHDRRLVGFLDSIQSDLRGSRTKILLLSRPSIRQMGPLITQHEIRSIHITPEINGGDLRRYCTTRLQNLVSERLLLLQTPGALDKLADTFLVGADGMFLWARLMFSYLRSPYLAPDRSVAARIRLRYIESLRYPETLNMMYSRILNLIGRFDNHMRSQARRVFCWLLFPKRHHLAAIELHDVITVTSFDGDVEDETARFIKEFDCQQNFTVLDESIISACCSLVEVSKDSDGTFYRFIHRTAIDFFLKRFELYNSASPASTAELSLKKDFSSQESLEPGAYAFFFLCPTEIEMELTSACTTYLRTRITPGPLSGNILQTANKSHVAEKYPFLAYASSFWTAHLRQVRSVCPHKTYSGNVRGLKENLAAFLEARLTMMTWVEAMYLLGRPADIYQHGPNILLWVSPREDGPGTGPDICAGLRDLCYDLETLERDWGNALREAPDHIWNDITAFFDSRFFVRTSATRVISLAPKALGISSRSSKYLSSISVSDTADSLMAVLTYGHRGESSYATKVDWHIDLLRDFELIWHLVSDTENVQQLFSACHGWVARYELWNTAGGSPTAMVKYTVPLDSGEVWQQLQHFLQRSPQRGKPTSEVARAAHTQMRKLAVSFPTTISCHDVGVFTILRTMYRISNSSAPVSSMDVQSFPIPLDFNENMRAIWDSHATAVPAQAANSRIQATRATKKLAYTYGFEFSHGNKYLLYHDTAGMSILPNGEMKLATTLAIFQLSQQTSWPVQPIRFLSQIESKPPEHYYSSWAIHPKSPIMAIFCRNTNGAPIMLWDFEDSMCQSHFKLTLAAEYLTRNMANTHSIATSH